MNLVSCSRWLATALTLSVSSLMAQSPPGGSRSLALDISLGYSFPQKKYLVPLQVPATADYGGPALSVHGWKHLFFYGRDAHSFAAGLGLGYLPFFRFDGAIVPRTGLNFYTVKAGVRHSMYFVRKDGFEQAVFVGLANPIRQTGHEVGRNNLSVSGYFGYYLPGRGRTTLGARWNWNFIWMRPLGAKAGYAHVLDISLRRTF